MVLAARAVRQNSRRQSVLDAAASLFRARGFHGTSIRDIAAAAGMTPGAIYSHFPSKNALLLEVYQEGIERITARVDTAIANSKGPRRQLHAACEAHLEMLLDQSDYAQVLIRVLPQDVPDVADRLTALRDGYERRFAELIEGLQPPRSVSRRHLRLFLLGAMNWAQVWYHAGDEPPRMIAGRLMAALKGFDQEDDDDRHPAHA